MEKNYKIGAVVIGVLILAVVLGVIVTQPSASLIGTLNNTNESGSSESSGGGESSDSQGSKTNGSSNQVLGNQNTNPTQPGVQYKACPTCKGVKTVVTGTKVRAPSVCDTCGGDGWIWTGLWKMCDVCGWDGRIEYPPQEIRGTCPTCGGAGQVPV